VGCHQPGEQLPWRHGQRGKEKRLWLRNGGDGKSLAQSLEPRVRYQLSGTVWDRLPGVRWFGGRDRHRRDEVQPDWKLWCENQKSTACRLSIDCNVVAGALPSPAMPQTFLAHAFDLGDPWTSNTCVTSGCCQQKGYNASQCPKSLADGCADACRAMTNTSFYMGPIHPVSFYIE
jgi:hypothetical protein